MTASSENLEQVYAEMGRRAGKAFREAFDAEIARQKDGTHAGQG